MKIINPEDYDKESAIKLIAFALDTQRILIGMKNDYLQEIQFLKEIK